VNDSIRVVEGRVEDAPVILSLIKALADYEKLSHQVVATEADIERWLFGAKPVAEVIIAWEHDDAVGFALFFHNFSTFLGRPGLYLEDLFVRREWRGRGIGRRLLSHLAGIALERGCGRFEWAVLDWNEPAIGFYTSLGAQPMHEWTVFRVAGDGLVTLATLKSEV